MYRFLAFLLVCSSCNPFVFGNAIPEKPFLVLDGFSEKPYYGVRDVCMTPDGAIYALNKEGTRVYKHDRKGRYLKTLGGKGQGPGEFTKCHSLLFVKGKLWVVDFMGYKLNLFENDVFVKSIQLESAYTKLIEMGEFVCVAPLNLSAEFLLFNFDGELVRKFTVDQNIQTELNELAPGIWRSINSAAVSPAELVIGFVFLPVIATVDLTGETTSVWEMDRYYSSYPQKTSRGVLPLAFSAINYAVGPKGLLWLTPCEEQDGQSVCSNLYQFNLTTMELVGRKKLPAHHRLIKFLNEKRTLVMIDEEFIARFYHIKDE
ncbi:MAG: hypothetical protein CSA81_12705 [Acidobacteria bacterium]|nr:MAG: hypothetical protein CSA81_12705 [Acidobacteriota bacterium]